MRTVRSLAALVLVATATLAGIAPVRAAASELVQSGSQPATHGTTVVWVNGSLFAARYPDGQPTVVAYQPGVIYSTPDVSGDLVVWSQACPGVNCAPSDTGLRAKNLATGQLTDLGTGFYPRISGTRLFYQDGPGLNLMLRDLATDSAPVVVATHGFGWEFASPRISGDRLAWAEVQPGGEGSTTGGWRIYTEVIGQDPVKVDESTAAGFYGLDLSGDELVYVKRDGQIQADNLATGAGQVITAAPYIEQPTTNGRYVFWTRRDSSPGTPAYDQGADLSGYDLQTESSFNVRNTGVDETAEARGDLLTWMHYDGPGDILRVHATSIASVLPSAPQPDPGATDPSWRYFPETGHYLAGGFLNCWQASGGLAIFGYPLTEEFNAIDAGSGQSRVVQYTERARFEYFGDDYSSGAACNPHLGRVGAEYAQQQGLLDTAPFQPLPADTGSDANCQFFAETGHRLCFGFRQFWQSHGLEFGAQYSAYWKSVALFGYPISEEYTDPATGLTVQYFERARFEYHPENQPPWDILGGHLGRTMMERER